MEDKTRKPISVRLPEDLKKALEDRHAQTGVSQQRIVEDALRAALK